ncbi:hypothetical protein BCR24_14800 [Enterococcus ureilyticus]|uniref:TNT domain-containing protein n=1 Tax=Enterococcus ureilyticus TaxID=1131292 RepID=A0A1E5HCI8_9ENTE|nr:glycohydrolase toxin TNT-related protein [Enterococcus ureilyticus]MBM7690343.1 hypothetical protein [Enterococcus ureilyticus]OEG22546.1 hypothetical protein BCR24_14800 [Enterococcus ureilyticus]
MADVKYTQSSWEKMGRDLGNLIGSGWGKGVHEELNDVTKNLEKAEDNITTYDEDGIISFSHTDRSSEYKEIGEKLKVLKDFTGQVNTILSTEIDDPFYKEMDAYVTAVRDLDITEYSVSNSLGIKETRTAYAMGSNMTYEVKKDKINLNDILNGDNPVGKAMVDEWKNYLKNNPGAKDLSYADYQKEALYSGAFEYESISDGQKKKEFWFNMAALATTVVVGIVFPPAGMVLGAALGGYEMLNAAVGKDLFSGRELGTGERWFRFGAGALGVFGGVKGLSSFSNNIKMVTGSSSTKMEHVVKMMQNSSRSSYKQIQIVSKTMRTHSIIKQTTCSGDELERYLRNINGDLADEFLKTGKWPEKIQVPKSSSVLTKNGGIDWSQVPEGGYVLDSSGNAIKKPSIPKIGSQFDRYGEPNGRYTSPLNGGQGYNYDQRSLPYIEDMSKYHKYEVTGDFSKIEEYVNNCSNLEIKQKIQADVIRHYDGDYEN